MRFFVGFISVALLSTAGMSIDRIADVDGCFATIMDGGQGPKICVSGAAEEGLSGEGARVVLFEANGFDVVWCAETTRSVNRDLENLATNQFRFFFDEDSGMEQISFDGEVDESGDQDGKISFLEIDSDPIEARYHQIMDEDIVRKLRRAAVDSELCK